MESLIHALFAAMLCLGVYFAWEAGRLFLGVDSRQTRRLGHLTNDRAASARRDYAYFNAAFAAEMLSIPSAALALRWPVPVWLGLITLLSLAMEVWSLVLDRRYERHAT